MIMKNWRWINYIQRVYGLSDWWQLDVQVSIYCMYYKYKIVTTQLNDVHTCCPLAGCQHNGFQNQIQRLLNYFAFWSFDPKHTWWYLFQEHRVRTKFYLLLRCYHRIRETYYCECIFACNLSVLSHCVLGKYRVYLQCLSTNTCNYWLQIWIMLCTLIVLVLIFLWYLYMK
jgi:hypothetical protein